MKLHKKLALLLTSLYGFYLLYDLHLYHLPNHTTLWNYWQNEVTGIIFFLGGVISISYGFRYSLRTNIGKMLFFYGLGLLSFSLGNLIWLYYNLFAKTALPYPSLADVGFGGYYPSMVLGTFFLLKVYQPLVNKFFVIGSAVVVVVAFIVIFGFLSKPDLSSGVTLLQKILNVYYPMADVVAVSLAFITILVNRGRLHRSLYILSLGLLFGVSADLTFSYMSTAGIYWNGSIADFLFETTGFVVSLGLVEIVHDLQNNNAKTQPAPVKQSV